MKSNNEYTNLIKNLYHNAGFIGFLFAVTIPLFIYIAPNVGLKEIISAWDLNLPFWLFFIQFALALVLIFSLAKDFLYWIKTHNISAPHVIAVSLVIAISLFVCISWIAPRHRVQSDESIFLSTAQNLYANQIAGSCDEGEFENGHLNCQKKVHNFKSKGEPFLYSIGILFLGKNLTWIFPLHLFLLVATIYLLYLAVRVWTNNHNLAFLTAALFAIQPTTLFQFRSTSVEPLYTLLFALSIFVWKWVWDKNTIKHWILFALILAFFAQTRQETAFCLGAFIFLSFPKILEKKDYKAPAFFAALSFFSIPVLLTISYYQGYNFQGGNYAAHGHFFENLKQAWNITVNTPLQNGLLKNPFLSYFTVFAVLGALALAAFSYFDLNKKDNKKQKNELKNEFKNIHAALFLLLYFPQIFMVLENVSGDLSIEINNRYMLIFFPVMAFLGAFLLDKISAAIPQKWRMFAIFAAAALLIFNTYRYGDSFKANIMYNRNHLTTEEFEILQWLRAKPEAPRLFVYARPWHFIGYGYSAIHYNSLNRQNLNSYLQKYNGEVYYVRGLDCWDSQTYHKKAVESRIPTVCDNFERQFPLTPVQEKIITNNYKLIIAKITESGTARNLFAPNIVTAELPENAQWLPTPTEHKQDWGDLKTNLSVTGHPLTIAGKRYAKGIGTHANAVLRYNLDKKYTRFTAVLGIDEDEFCSNGIKIRILGDNNVLVDTGELMPNKEYQVDIPLNGVQQLTLEADGLGDINCDHVDIAIPVLYQQ